MAEFIAFLVLFFAIGALPPPCWGLRIAALLALLAALAVLTMPTPYDPDLSYHLLLFAVTSFAGAILAGVTLRQVISLASPPSQPARPYGHALAATDHLLRAGAGVWLGCLFFLILAVLLQSNTGGLPLHAAVATIALLAPVALWRTALRSTALGAGLMVAILTYDSAIRYPDLILTAATRLLPDQPRCLMLGPDLHPPRSRADLMALTMPKDRTGPSDALLLIQTDAGPRLYRWSFRARRLQRAPAHTGSPSLCTPSRDRVLPD